METVSYILILAVGLLLAAWLFHLSLARTGQKRILAWMTLPLGAVLGFVLAKGIYVLFHLEEVFSLYGAGGLIRMNPEEFSFVGGCGGFVLACVLSARLLRMKTLRALDCFAGPLALGVAFARGAESFLGNLGHGEDLTEVEWTHFFPMSTEVSFGPTYSEWYMAVNLHLALLALLCVLMAVGWLRTREDTPGVCFGRTLVMLCAPLFILELMRAVSVTILVRVHVEQILCFAVMAACILTAAVRVRRSAAGIVAPALLLVLVIGLNIALQFGVDGKLDGLVNILPISEGAREWMIQRPADWCYPLMILTDMGLVAMELVLTRRRSRQ